MTEHTKVISRLTPKVSIIDIGQSYFEGNAVNPSRFELQHGKIAVIEVQKGALTAFEDIVSAHLELEVERFFESCVLHFEYDYDAESERPREVTETVDKFKIDVLGNPAPEHARLITIQCNGMTDTDSYCIFQSAEIVIEHVETVHLEERPDNRYNKTKLLPIADAANATLHIPSGGASLAICDIEDPVLGFSLYHYLTPDFDAPAWHTNLDATLSTTGRLYVDSLGFRHAFDERFYALNQRGAKTNRATVLASMVTVDADGRLWYRGEEVFRDLRTPKGLRASSRLQNVNDAEWVEERYEEEQQATAQFEDLQKYLCHFVKVKENTKMIHVGVTKSVLETTDAFEAFCKAEGILFSSEEEALQFCNILKSLESFPEGWPPERLPEKEELEKQKELYKNRAEEYTNEIRKRYVEYRSAKSIYEHLAESVPVSFLFSDDGETGYNKQGALVTLHTNGGKPLAVVRDKYDNTEKRRITMVHDEEGNAVRFYYNEDGRLVRVVNSLEDEVIFAYSGEKLSSITRPHSPKLSFNYEGGRISTVSDEYAKSSFTFDEMGRLSEFARSTTVAAIAHGCVEHGEELLLSSFGIAYEEDCLRISDRLKPREEVYFFDDHHVTETYVIESGKVVQAEECELDEKTKLVARRYGASPGCLGKYSLDEFDWIDAEEKTYTYNDFYECTQTVAWHRTPDNKEKEKVETTTAYNEKGDPLSVFIKRTLRATATSAEKIEKSLDLLFYNENGNLIKRESYTIGKEHQLGYDIEEIYYDEAGRETRRVSYNSILPSDKLYTEQSYDEKGRVSIERDETGKFETKFFYDGNTPRLLVTEDARGTSVAHAEAYTGNDRSESVTTSTEDGEGNTESVYYTSGFPVRVTNGRHVFNYTYDGKGRVVNIHLDDSDYLSKVYTENEDGTETVTTSHAGFDATPLSVTSDKFGEVKRRYIPGVKDVSYAYTHDGRVTRETDVVSGHQKSYSYDIKYRLVRCGSFDGISTVYSYDEEDRIVAREEALAEPIVSTFVYDPDTKLLSCMTVDDFAVLPAYDAMGRETERTVRKNGSFLHSEKIAYAKYGDHATMRPSTMELSSATDSTRLKYSYDEMGNIDKIYEDGILSVRYEYDALGRLSREDNRAFESTSLWEYDKSGNILSRRTYAFTVAPTEELLTSTPTETLIYGYAGDCLMSINEEQLFHYSAEGHPDLYRGMPVTWHAPRMLATLGDSYFSYNADGLCTSFNGQPHYYSYDGRLIYDSILEYFYDESGAVLGFTHGLGGPRYLYRRDAQGNIIAILDSEGNVVVKYKYNAWGEHKVLGADGNPLTDGFHVGHLNRFRYRGYYYVGAGLYYLKSRFYDAKIGRFICADSLDYLDPHTVGGLNLFAYCDNNPVMGYDPEGTINWQKIGKIAAAVAKIAVCVAAVVVVAAASTVTGGAAGVVLAGAAVGASVGMASGAISAAVAGGGLTEIADAMVNGTVSGGVSGAIAAAPVGVAGQVVANAGLGAANYVMNQSVSGDSITLGGLGASAVLGGIVGFLGKNGWQHKQSLGLTAASLSRNGLKYGLGIASAKNLRNMTIPALIFGALGGCYGVFGKQHNPTGRFLDF